MFIDSKNNLFQAVQNVVQELNVDTLVQTISENTKAAQNALRFVDSMQMSTVAGIANPRPKVVAGPGETPPINARGSTQESPGHFAWLGEAINNAFLLKYPDLKMDGKMEKYDSEGVSNNPKVGTNVYVVNGVHQDEDSRAKQAKSASKTLGKPVNLIHNSSAGFPWDALEYMKETLFGCPSPASEKLSDELYKKLTRKPPADVEIVSYSQGSTQTAIALSMTIKRMKDDGMTDEQIREIMREHVDVTCVGTPLDPSNPSQAVWNVPPGMIPSEKRLDWYFQEQDIVLHGGNPASGQTINTEPGGEPNFKMIRHEKDPVASWVRSTGNLADLGVIGFGVATMGPFFLFNPVVSTYVGVRLLDLGSKIFENVGQEQDPFGYHDYEVYDHYMRHGFDPAGKNDQPPAPDNYDYKTDPPKETI